MRKEIKILIGGSPCTYWSIAKGKNRETTSEGLGWELFKNYLIAKEKFKPDYFLYENVSSANKDIKEEIFKELSKDGADENVRLTEINSALVSAQNRKRFYVTNFGDIEQPEDREIFLKDILEDNASIPLNDSKGKSNTITARYGSAGSNPFSKFKSETSRPRLAVKVGILPNKKGEMKNSQGSRIYKEDGKSVTLQAQSGGLGARTGLYAIGIASRTREDADGKYKRFESNESEKSNAITTVNTDSMVACRAEDIFSSEVVQKALKKIEEKYGYIPGKFNAYNKAEIGEKSPTLTTGSMVSSSAAVLIFEEITDLAKEDQIKIKMKNGKEYQIYVVQDGKMYIKGKSYKVKLEDGIFIIRKLTPIECERLQTMPDGYTGGVSDSQRYKMLGNGWTAEVIEHILNHALKDVDRNTKIKVLSMYDGMGTGRYVLDKMGFKNVEYTAFEIDKYAIQVALKNYPDIKEMGDAFKVREDNFCFESGGKDV